MTTVLYLYHQPDSFSPVVSSDQMQTMEAFFAWQGMITPVKIEVTGSRHTVAVAFVVDLLLIASSNMGMGAFVTRIQTTVV